MTRYILMVFAGACSYGALSTIVKLAYREGYHAAEISFTQALLGMAVLWLLVLLREKIRFRVNWPLLWTGAAIGLTSFVYYLSVRYIAASLAIVLLMQFVWMGILLDWLLFKQRPGWLQIVSTLLVLAGSVLAGGVLKETPGAADPAGWLTGVLLALGSAFLYAVFVVANSRYGNELHPLRKSAVIMTGSTLGIGLVNLHTLATQPFTGYGLWKWTVLLALFGTIIPPVLFAKGIPRIGAGVSAVVMTAELPVAVIAAGILLGEQLDAVQWCGVVLILLAIAWLKIGKRSS
ncbi:DMT family transporter [Chitinophaga sp. YIM B06452]|uniref:EamA family transporter n=1 Tax=Chitinophaga sp. YIM B06452 TaxID=3082158 RepID=UPI0031FEAEF1